MYMHVLWGIQITNYRWSCLVVSSWSPSLSLWALVSSLCERVDYYNKQKCAVLFFFVTHSRLSYRLGWRIYRSCSTFSKIVNKGKSLFTEVADSRVGDFLSSNLIHYTCTHPRTSTMQFSTSTAPPSSFIPCIPYGSISACIRSVLVVSRNGSTLIFRLV